jgi:hypothetical protein
MLHRGCSKTLYGCAAVDASLAKIIDVSGGKAARLNGTLAGKAQLFRKIERQSRIRSLWSRILRIIVKTFPAFSPEPAGVDVFFEQRTRAIFRVADAFVEDV